MKKLSLAFLFLLLMGILWATARPEAGASAEIQLALESPSWNSWLGKDSLGRDVMIRVLQGAKVSVGLGLSSSLAALLLGLIVGAISAMSPRAVDSLCMRVVEVLMSLPNLMLIAVLALVLQTQMPEANLTVLFGALALGSWMSVAKLTRNLILQEKVRDYVEAARAIGASRSRIFSRHILPNIVSPLLTYWSLQVPHAIVAEGILSFLGFGVKSPGISWGALLQEGWKTLANYPHLLLGPSLVLFLTVLSLNVLLENIRQNLDPKLKWEKFS